MQINNESLSQKLISSRVTQKVRRKIRGTSKQSRKKRHRSTKATKTDEGQSYSVDKDFRAGRERPGLKAQGYPTAQAKVRFSGRYMIARWVMRIKY